MKDVGSVARSFLLVLLLVFIAGGMMLAQNPKMTVSQAYHHDVSRPLRDIGVRATGPITGAEIEAPRPGRPLPGSDKPAGEDSVIQRVPLPMVSTTDGLNFEGVSANGYAPPDTNGSVGIDQYVQTTNVEFAVYSKSSGATLLGPILLGSVWTGFGGDCDPNVGNGGDPVMVFDKAAQRWIISQLAGNYNSWCMAVSTSSDATGTYYRYAFSSGGNLDDYPKLGVWPDAYYRSSNTFGNGAAKACAYDRNSMLAGGNANQICFQTTSEFSFLPADLDGATPPPAGSPNYFIELGSTTSLSLFKFHVDFANPANSTFTGPTTITVASYSQLGSVPQPNGDGTRLDSLSDRLMNRLSYRNFGDHEALVVTHSVTAGSSGGTRWYEIRDPNGSATLFQQGTFAPDSSYRWMGSIATDGAGDIALGYSLSSSSIHPSIAYTGRVPGDPLGQMESEDVIFNGTGSQNGGLSRWGDYSNMAIDPVDDCTFWYTTEYIPTDGSFNWHTRIGSFSFNSCSGNPGWALSSGPGSAATLPGGTVGSTITATPFNGYSGTIGLTLSGCPTGATCNLNPTSITLPPAGTSSLTVATSSSTPAGNYVVTITGNDGTTTHTTAFTVVVQDFTVKAAPASQTVKKGAGTTYTATVAAVNGFNGTVALSVSGLPANATATFNPTSVNGAGKSTVTITTSKKTPVGTYTLGIKGSSGSVSHSANVSLKVSNNGR